MKYLLFLIPLLLIPLMLVPVFGESHYENIFEDEFTDDLDGWTPFERKMNNSNLSYIVQHNNGIVKVSGDGFKVSSGIKKTVLPSEIDLAEPLYFSMIYKVTTSDKSPHPNKHRDYLTSTNVGVRFLDNKFEAHEYVNFIPDTYNSGWITYTSKDLSSLLQGSELEIQIQLYDIFIDDREQVLYIDYVILSTVKPVNLVNEEGTSQERN